MDQQAIIKSLSKLEDSLKDVNSAAEMVRKTTAAYGAVQGELKKYSDSLSGISIVIKNMLSEIKSNNDLFNQTLENNINDKLLKLESVIMSLQEADNALNSNINGLSDNFKNNIQEVILQFEKSIHELSDCFKKNTEEEILQIETRIKSIDEAIDVLRDVVDSIEAKITAVLGEMQNNASIQHKTTCFKLNLIIFTQFLCMVALGGFVFWVLRYGMTN